MNSQNKHPEKENEDISPLQRRVRKGLPATAAMGLLATTLAIGAIGSNKSSDVDDRPITDEPVPTTVYIAQNGDSAWDIANREIEESNIPRDDVDIRPIVDDIVERNGDIHPGDRVELEDLPYRTDAANSGAILPPVDIP